MANPLESAAGELARSANPLESAADRYKRYLLDFLQGASNEAAGTVSAPVDGLAWLLRKAGIPVNAPIGGSDWMEQRGLTRPVKQSAAQVAGATAGLLSPVAAAAKAPQIARGLLQAGDNLAAPSTIPRLGERGMIPVKFEKAKTFAEDGSMELKDGIVFYKTAFPQFDKYEITDAVRKFANEKIMPKYEHMFRFTNNPKEFELAKKRQLRNSYNHTDKFEEAGLSVASGPHYSTAGYKFGYPVSGKVVGYGSDGEPLIDPKTMSVIGDSAQPAIKLAVDGKKRIAENVKALGLPDTFLEGGVSFQNFPYDIWK